MSTLRIFISSVMEEFIKERAIVEEAIQEISQTPIRFEIFPAYSGSPEKIIFDQIKQCDIFILLIGNNISDIVIDEFKLAVENEKDIFIFKKNVKMDNDTMRFFNEIKSKYTYRNFENTKDLNVALKNSVQYLLVERFRNTKDKKEKTIDRLDKKVKLVAGEEKYFRYEDLMPGNKLKGVVREVDGDTFNVYFVNQENFTKFCNNEKFEFWGEENTSAYSYNLPIEEEDDYYLIFKSPAVMLDRIIIVELRFIL